MISIAIDGTSGSGKSSIAGELAKRLGYLHLNTGELYRAIAYKLVADGLDYNDEKVVNKMISSVKISVKYESCEQITFVNEQNVQKYLHTPQMSKVSAVISQYPKVRESIKQLQRDIASQNNIVIEGRDIGTEILPNATYKFFVTANDEVRAERRYKQLVEDGQTNIELNQILLDIKERDRIDMTRKYSPLRKAPDSIEIDNSILSFEQIVANMLEKIR